MDVFSEADKLILWHLKQYSGSYFTSEELGLLINKSGRTVRKYLKNLQDELPRNGAKIVMKKGLGYTLEIKQQELFHSFLEGIQHLSSLDQSEARETFIVGKILLENTQWILEDFMQELYISRTTLLTELSHIRKKLKPFGLTLEYGNKMPIMIEGSELEKRRFIIQYLMQSNRFDGVLNEMHSNFLPYEPLLIIVIEEVRKASLGLSDFLIQNLVLHLQLSAKRILDGHIITGANIQSQDQTNKSILVTKRLTTRIEELYGIHFPDSEIEQIAWYLQSRTNVGDERIIEAQRILFQAMKAALEELKKQMEFAQDPVLEEGLLLHLQPLQRRAEKRAFLVNPILKEIEERYTAELQVIKETFEKVPLFAGWKLSPDEWSYLSLHILAAQERAYREQVCRVLVICSTGVGSAQLLKNRLEKEFGSRIEIVEVISYYQLTQPFLKKVDLIISTIDVQANFFSVPIVKASVLLDENDIKEINYYLKKKNHKMTASHSNSRDELNELFDLYFSKERFISLSDDMSKKESIQTLIESLPESSDSSFKQAIQEQIDLREKVGTVAFTPDIAFPHPLTPIALNGKIVIGYHASGIRWDTEHTAIHFVVLFSPSKIENKKLSLVMERFAEFIQDEEKINEWKGTPSFEVFKKLFIQ